MKGRNGELRACEPGHAKILWRAEDESVCPLCTALNGELDAEERLRAANQLATQYQAQRRAVGEGNLAMAQEFDQARRAHEAQERILLRDCKRQYDKVYLMKVLLRVLVERDAALRQSQALNQANDRE